MIVVGPLLVIVIIAMIVVLAGRSRGPTRAGRPLPRSSTGDELQRWTAAGLLTEQQAAAILAYEQAGLVSRPAPVTAAPEPAPRRRVPVIAESLGYLGGVLAVVGLVLMIARYWPDMPAAGRLALSGGAALALVGAGALVREKEDPALARFRWFVWLASSAATAVFAGVLVVDGFGSDYVPTVVAGCAGSVALESGLLWWWRERPLQQLVALGGLVVFAGAIADELAQAVAIGVTVWTVGVVLLVLGLRRLTPLALVTEGVGAAAVAIGSAITTDESQSFGLLFLVGSAFALVALAAVPGPVPARAEQRMLAVLGSIALWQAVPSTLVHFARDAGVATGITTWAIGGVLFVVGMRRLVRAPLLVEVVGGVTVVGGAAVTGAQSSGFAPVFGIFTGIVLLGLGMRSGQVLTSVFGSLALVVNVPWAIGRFFPGEGRAPLLILVTGALILGIAVLLTRMGGRFRRDIPGRHRGAPPSTFTPGHVS